MSHPEARPIRLLLVDDHQTLRLGLKTLFDSFPEFVVVGQAGDAAEGVALSLSLRPDVVLMDLRLPDGSGVEACRDIRARYQEIRVLFLTSYVDAAAVFATVMAGAQGYLLKEVSGDVLVESVRKIAHGGACLDPRVAEQARNRINALSDPRESEGGLSPQEQRVMAYLAEGLTNKHIAAALHLSEKTVRNYLTSVFRKLKVSCRAEAVSLYAKQQAMMAMVPLDRSR